MPSDFTMLNLIVCVLGFWICLCRSKDMKASRTKAVIRYQYTGWAMMFVASGISFLWGERATSVQLAISCWVVAHLMIGWGAWRHGPPRYTEKRVSAWGGE